MLKTAAVTAALLVPLTVAAAANPVGRYTVEGTGPGRSETYRGTVEVTRTGDTFQVVWEIAGERYVGTAIGRGRVLSVSYRSGDEGGLGVYVAEDGAYRGVWTWLGGTRLGRERWVRR